MNQPPPAILLSILAGIGTAVASPFTVNESILFIPIIPLSILAAYWYKIEDGFVVASIGSIIAMILIPSIGWQTATIYLLASGIGIWLTSSYTSKEYDWAFLILWTIIGVLLLELFLDLFQGTSTLLHSDFFLGRNADSGIRIAINTITGFILYNLWPEKNKENKKEE